MKHHKNLTTRMTESYGVSDDDEEKERERESRELRRRRREKKNQVYPEDVGWVGLVLVCPLLLCLCGCCGWGELSVGLEVD